MTNQLLDVLEALETLQRSVAKLAEGILRESGSCESQAGAALAERARVQIDALRVDAVASAHAE
jgi:hypothetical protein